MSILSWHQDQVCEVPQEARVIGSSDHCRYARLAYKGNALSIQPHPEFDADFVDGLFDNVGLQAVGTERTRKEQSRLRDTLDADKIARVMADFFLDPDSWPPS